MLQKNLKIKSSFIEKLETKNYIKLFFLLNKVLDKFKLY